MPFRPGDRHESKTPGRWADRAACEGQPGSMFFPGPGDSNAPAKAVCARCPVRADCLEFAVATSQHHGIWGGLSERERERLRRARRRAA